MAILAVLTGWLASRLVLLFHDDRIPTVALVALALAQAGWILLLLGIDAPSLVSALGVVALLVIEERVIPQSHINEGRLLVLIIVLVCTFLLRHQFGSSVATYVSLHAGDRVLWVICGLLLSANEANLAIRSIFHSFNLEPQVKSDDTVHLDTREYNAGRVIGILERWLMYAVLVVSQNYNVIAIIIAAKGFARFRDMDNREFAEYVLIGTLASTLLTIVIAQGVMLFGHLPTVTN